MNIIKLLKKNILFQNFDDKEINDVFDNLQGRIVKFSRGGIIAQQGSQVDEIGILLSGLALKYITKSDGTNEAQETLKAGDMFGAVEGFFLEKKLPYSLVAAEDMDVLYITIKTIIINCNDAHPAHQKLLLNTLTYLAESIRTVNKDSEYLIIKSMRAKIAKLVYDKYLMQDNMDIELGMNRNEMAEYLNVSRPSMSREMMRMRDEGIIDFRKDRVSIKNLQEIKDIVNNI